MAGTPNLSGDGNVIATPKDFDLPSNKKPKKNKYAFACALLASMISILLGYGNFSASNARQKNNDFSPTNSVQYSQSQNPYRSAPQNPMFSSIDELEQFYLAKNNNNFNENIDVHSGDDSSTNSAAASVAAMKDAMDHAEAKFRHAKELRDREHAKAARSKESVQLEKDEQEIPDDEIRENQERLNRERQQREREDQEERNRVAETLDTEIRRWAAGKEGNLRTLLSTLQYVLWPECGWQPVSLTDLITGASVKKVYRKATLCIHPDKVEQKGANLQQKYIAEKVFDLLKEAWNKFNSEELF